LSGYVLHNSLLHLLLKNGDFLNTDISQGSVATRLGCGGVFIYRSLCYKFPTDGKWQILSTVAFLFFFTTDSTDSLDCLPIPEHIFFYFLVFFCVPLFSFWFRAVD